MHIIVLPGDGIGSELVAATSSVLRTVSDRFNLSADFERSRLQ
jgi:3-isopropylmalate dehydrogenase